MDPRRNPYALGAGTRPTELAGRTDIIANVEVALDRIRAGRSTQVHMLIGLRGVGKRGGSVDLHSPARLLSGASAGFMPLREAVG